MRRPAPTWHVVVAIATVASLALTSPAMARESVIAQVANDSPLTAYGGWVLWSELTPSGRWARTAWHRGNRVRLAVRTRAAPFDVDAGPDKNGHAVVLYSRCAQEPDSPRPYQSVAGYISPAGIPRWSSGAGCRLYRLNLSTGNETRVRAPASRGASDTTPSQWFGRIAFARRTPGGRTSQLLVWSPKSGRLVRLAHGSFPDRCPFPTGCADAAFVGEVQQLDLGADVAAFLWQVQAPSVIGVGPAWELRADLLRTRRGVLLATGYESGTCGGAHPVAPSVAGGNVWFANVTYDCDSPHTLVVHGDAATGVVGTRETSRATWQVARDRSALYAIRSRRPVTRDDHDPPCLGAAGPCDLVRQSTPTAPPITKRPSPPFF